MGRKRRGTVVLVVVVAAMSVVRCGSSGETAEQGSASSGDEVAAQPTLQGHMEANFDLALSARDGIIAGSLIQAKDAAVKMAEHDYAVVLPAEWMPGVERMQSVARELAVAENLEQGAVKVATLAQTCGECHATFESHDHGRAVEGSKTGFGQSENVHDRMMRHQRAADGFWFGLTMPSNEAWKSGAQALLDAPAAPVGKDGKPVGEAMMSRLEEVRGIARRALTADATADRVGLYAEFLAKCSSCHTGT
jgi:mono/diheme cytochrome c family protein